MVCVGGGGGGEIINDIRTAISSYAVSLESVPGVDLTGLDPRSHTSHTTRNVTQMSPARRYTEQHILLKFNL